VPLGDGIHWQLSQSTFLDFNDITITTTNPVLNTLIAPFHGMIANFLKTQLPKVSGSFQKAFDQLNRKLRAGGNNFMTKVLDPRYPINLTTTQPPFVNTSTKVLEINFDGTIYDTIQKTNHVSKNTFFPSRIEGLNNNQVLIHQSMLGSLMMAISHEYLPYTVNRTNLTSQILQLFPEINDHYGKSIITDLDIDITSESGDFLTLDNTTGIEIGKNQKLKVKLEVRCSNSSQPEETAVQFDFELAAKVNTSINSQW